MLRAIVAELQVGMPEEPNTSPQDDDKFPPAERIKRIMRRETKPTWVAPESRRVEVRFSGVIAWQVIDESFTVLDDYEERDGMDKLRILSRSRYLDLLTTHHGWFDVMRRPSRLYEICTLSDIVWVLAEDPPVVERYPPSA